MATSAGHFLSAVWTCVLLICPTTRTFNLDVNPRTVTMLETPASPAGNQYFGYSVALHSDGSSKWMMVGAPLANVSSNLQHYGTVYKCSPKSKDCKEIELDHEPIQRKNTMLNNTETMVDLEIKSGQWLGAVIHSTGESGGPKDKAVICAPRYIYRGFPPFADSDMQFAWPLGRCYLMEGSLKRIKKILEPCKSKPMGNALYGYCQAGMSAAYADPDTVVLGAVGMAQSSGGLVSYSHDFGKTAFSTRDQLDVADYMGYSVVGGHFSKPSSIEFVGGAPRADNLKGKVLIYSFTDVRLPVMSPLPTPDNIGVGSYFGSALCAVDLNDDRYTDVLVGAPRFTETMDEGRVFVFINNKKGALNLIETVLKGDNKPGAQFGSAFAAVGDLNKDGFQDVAIGAPYEADGAGTGAVYIYHGRSEGIEQDYRQKILASSFGQGGLKLFGHSISGNVDVDLNKYPDVAVGAYGSEKAVFLRSRRIIDVTGEVTLSKSRILLDSNVTSCTDKGAPRDCLEATIRFKYSDPTRPSDKNLKIEYSLELDRDVEVNLRRMYFHDHKSELSIVKGSHTFNAQNTLEVLGLFKVFIVDTEKIADVVSDLTFDLTYSLNETSGCIDSLCPVLNDYTKHSARVVAFFQKKCISDNCVLDLAVNGEIDYPGDYQELRIGLVNEMTVQLTVENLEQDTAYDAKVILTYPSFLGYIGVRSEERIICEKSLGKNSTSILTCTVGNPANPLPGNSKRKFGVKFSTKHVKKDFYVKIEISSGVVEDRNKHNNKDELPVQVKFEADLEIKGSSNPDQVVYSEEEAKDLKRMLQKDIGPKVVQTIQIRNNGPSAVDGSEVSISLPSFYGKGTGPDNYLLYLLKVELTGPGTCSVMVNPNNILKDSVQNNATEPERERQLRKRREIASKTLDCRRSVCKTFTCSLGLLHVGSTVEIGITARLWQSTLVKNKVGVADLETDVEVESPAKFSQSNVDNDRVTITLRANPAKSEVEGKSTPWYVILAAVLGGVLLLAIAATVLYKFGFFRRRRFGKDMQADEMEPMNE